MAFLFVPITAMSVAHISKVKMGNATSIFNLVRNIGGSFGIAIMTTFLARRGQLHTNHLVERVTPYSLGTQQMLAGMQGWFRSRGADSFTAMRRAYAGLWGMVHQQAAMISFVEAFWVLSAIFFLMIPLVFIMRTRKTPEKHVEHAEPAEPTPRVRAAAAGR
jgi:DHA2 family multidrug resistance protein